MDPKLHEGIALCQGHRCVPRAWHIVGLTGGMHESMPSIPPTPAAPISQGRFGEGLPHPEEVVALKAIQEERTRPFSGVDEGIRL